MRCRRWRSRLRVQKRPARLGFDTVGQTGDAITAARSALERVAADAPAGPEQPRGADWTDERARRSSSPLT